MIATVVGAGNIGTQLMAHCYEAGYEVIVYTSNPQLIHDNIEVIDENGISIHKGKVKKATSNEKEAFENSELVFVTTPAFMMDKVANEIMPYANPNMKICLVPGTGGGECAFKRCLEKGAVVFGMQRVPSVARLVEKGHIVRAVGYRNEMYVAALPNCKSVECARIIEKIVGIRTYSLPNYLNLTLTPSNPILHTTRLKTLFGDYKTGKIYTSVPLFYEEWDNNTSELLFKCDDEVQQICNSIKEFDLSYVKSLKVHYESHTVDAFTKKIQSIEGFKGLKSPIIEKEYGFVPDFSSRYFTADFPYGLSILVQISNLLGLDSLNMKGVLNWYYSIVEVKDEFSYKKYGITSYKDLINFYKR